MEVKRGKCGERDFGQAAEADGRVHSRQNAKPHANGGRRGASADDRPCRPRTASTLMPDATSNGRQTCSNPPSCFGKRRWALPTPPETPPTRRARASRSPAAFSNSTLEKRPRRRGHVAAPRQRGIATCSPNRHKPGAGRFPPTFRSALNGWPSPRPSTPVPPGLHDGAAGLDGYEQGQTRPAPKRHSAPMPLVSGSRGTPARTPPHWRAARQRRSPREG